MEGAVLIGLGVGAMLVGAFWPSDRTPWWTRTTRSLLPGLLCLFGLVSVVLGLAVWTGLLRG